MKQQQQFIEEIERSIFQELSDFITERQLINKDVEMVERLVQEERGVFRTQQQQQLWINCFRLPWELRQFWMQQQQRMRFAFKVKLDEMLSDDLIVKIYTPTELWENLRQSAFKIALRMPNILREQLRRRQQLVLPPTRCHITREGIVLVQIPCAMINEEKEQKLVQQECVKVFTVIKQKAPKRLCVVEQPQRSIFEELAHLLLEETPVPRDDLEQLLELLARRDYSRCRGEWVQVLRLQQYCPQEVSFTIKRYATFVALKVYAKKQFGDCEEKCVLRLPGTLNLYTEKDWARQLRIVFTREGLLVVRAQLPTGIYEENSSKSCFQPLVERKTCVIKRVVDAIDRSIFEELLEHQQQPQEPEMFMKRDILLLEQVLKRRNYFWGDEWLTFVRLAQLEQHQSQPSITFKVSKDTCGNTIVKICAQKLTTPYLCADEPFIYGNKQVVQTIVRLPSYFTKREVRQHLRVQLTREGLVLLRLPVRPFLTTLDDMLFTTTRPYNNTIYYKCREIATCSKMRGTTLTTINNTNTNDNKLVIVHRREVERCERGIFETLMEPETRYFSEKKLQQTTGCTIYEQLRELLRQCDNVLNNGREWVQVMRVPTTHGYYKVKRERITGEAYVKIATPLESTGTKKVERTIICLPRKHQLKLEIHATRVQLFPREGIVVIRVPLCQPPCKNTFGGNDTVYYDNASSNNYYSGNGYIFGQPCRMQMWKEELLTEEMRRLRRSIYEDVLPRWAPYYETVATFYKMFKPSTYKHQLHLTVTLPTAVRPQDFVVKAREQFVALEMLKGIVDKELQRRAFWMPRQVCVDKMEVKLMGQRQLCFIFPILERCERSMPQCSYINATSNTAATLFQQEQPLRQPIFVPMTTNTPQATTLLTTTYTNNKNIKGEADKLYFLNNTNGNDDIVPVRVQDF